MPDIQKSRAFARLFCILIEYVIGAHGLAAFSRFNDSKAGRYGLGALKGVHFRGAFTCNSLGKIAELAKGIMVGNLGINDLGDGVDILFFYLACLRKSEGESPVSRRTSEAKNFTSA